jgi:hypothetical protein
MRRHYTEEFMGLTETFMKRAERIVTREVPGVGPVRFKRLTWQEFRDLPNTQGETVTAATVLQDDKEELFFSGPDAVLAADFALGVALAQETMKVNGLDAGEEPDATEKKS